MCFVTTDNAMSTWEFSNCQNVQCIIIIIIIIIIISSIYPPLK